MPFFLFLVFRYCLFCSARRWDGAGSFYSHGAGGLNLPQGYLSLSLGCPFWAYFVFHSFEPQQTCGLRVLPRRARSTLFCSVWRSALAGRPALAQFFARSCLSLPLLVMRQPVPCCLQFFQWGLRYLFCLSHWSLTEFLLLS